MSLLYKDFLRRGWLRALMSGIAVALSLVSLTSYVTEMNEMKARVGMVFAANMPADGCLNVYSGSIDPATQEVLAQIDGVEAVEFTAIAPVMLSTGPGALEGVDFGSPHFQFTLASGRLPIQPGEAVVDASFAAVADIVAPQRLDMTAGSGLVVAVTIVGILDATARAPSGVLAERAFCLEQLGGTLSRCWVWAPDERIGRIMGLMSEKVPSSSYTTSELWRDRYSSTPTVAHVLAGLLLGVLGLAVAMVLWGFAKFALDQNARLLAVVHAFGVAPSSVRGLFVAEGALGGIVAVLVLIGSAFWVLPVTLSGPWLWRLVPAALGLPVLANVIASRLLPLGTPRRP